MIVGVIYQHQMRTQITAFAPRHAGSLTCVNTRTSLFQGAQIVRKGGWIVECKVAPVIICKDSWIITSTGFKLE